MNLTQIRAGAFVLGLALPSLAFAQSTPVYQSGTMSAAHDLAKITRNGQVQDAGGIAGDTLGRGINPFLILDSLSDAFCANTAATTGSYHSLCIGHNSSGSPIFKIDGTSYPFLPGGTGNVIGPNSSVVGDVALFNSTSGVALKGGGPGKLTDTVSGAVTADYANLAVHSVAGLSANTVLAAVSAAGPNWDGIRSMVSVTPASSAATTSALGGYLVNNQAASGGLRNGVALFGVVENATAGANSWGFNVVGGEPGGLANTVFQNEIDFNGRNASSVWTGLAFTGATTAQPASAVGVICESFGAGMIYNSGCINSTDGVAVTGLVLGGGVGAPGAAAFSQKIQQTAYTAAATPVNGTIYLDNGKNYNMDAPAGGAVLLRIGTTPVLEAITATPGAGNTGMSVIYNGNAGIGLGQVAVGAADSGGAGFRMLRVSN